MANKNYSIIINNSEGAIHVYILQYDSAWGVSVRLRRDEDRAPLALHVGYQVAEQVSYSEMQSDGNSFYGDVVLDSVNMAYRGGDSILDQIQCKANMFGFL